MRIDQQLAEKWIKPGSSVLDLGVVTVNYCSYEPKASNSCLWFRN